VKGKPVKFTASDGRQVEGAVLRSAGHGAPAVVLVHMLNGGASQWDGVQPDLRKAGFTTLAYDGRGGLDEAELLKEVRGAVRFLQSRGVGRIGVVGGSIGATTALLASSTLGSEVGAVVALSPADSPLIFKLQSRGKWRPRAALMLSDEGEKTNVDNVVQGARGSRRAVAPIAGHGTDLLTDARVRAQVIDWLRAHLASRTSSNAATSAPARRSNPAAAADPATCRRLSRRLRGRRLADAMALARKANCAVRVVERDGHQLVVTEDFSPTRINVKVSAGSVTEVAGLY
jgi:pimeloyl-ACP methyl ester carboxylesterase